MTETDILPEAVAGPVARPGTATFAIGVTSYNSAATIGPVLTAIHAGLRRVFAEAPAVIIHADGGSKDDTAQRARDAVPDQRDLLQITYPTEPSADRASLDGLPGKSIALREIFERARALQVRGLAVIDANVTSVTPEWVARLAEPVARGSADYVAPYYVRHRFDGATTNGIAYPLTRALYGLRVRYPLAGEFACSAKLLDHYLGHPWPGELAKLGGDVWLMTQALSRRFRVIQAWLGVRTQAGADGGDLTDRQARVLSALFAEVERNAPVWQKVRGSEPVPLYGEPSATVIPPEPAAVDLKRALDSFRLGQKNLSEVWGLVLPPGSLLALRRLALQPDATFRFPDELWARTVYDFALAYRTRVMNRDHLLSAFIPLFLGWFGAFVSELGDAEPARVDHRIEQLSARYEAEKPYLISRWRWPDRFLS